MACTSYMMALVLTVTPSAMEQQSDAAVLLHAETAFTKGLQVRAQPAEAKTYFQDATQSYKLLLQRGARNAGLFRNLGSASLLAGDLPQAILAYRMGLQLAPGDRLLQANLDYARGQVAHAEGGGFARPPWEQRPFWLPRIPRAWQLLIAFVAYGALWLALMRWWMLRRSQLLGAAAAAGAVTALLVGSLLAAEWKSLQEVRHPVVIIADDGVLVRSGNGFAYPRRYDIPLNRGVEARLLYAREGWLQVELSGGEVGWVPAAYTIRSLD